MYSGMSQLRSSRVRGVFAAAAVATATAVATFAVPATAGAAPSGAGSPLVGPYCSEGAAIAGSGASFAKNAHEGAFKPAFRDDCGLAVEAGADRVTYNSIGSGGGRKAICARSVAFAGSDEPLTDDQKAQFEAGDCDADGTPESGGPSPIHQIPIAIGAVAVPYNLTACNIGNEQLKLTSPMLSAIFAGEITAWNDPQLTGVNPDLATCTESITRAVRSDVSGTTYVFKDYLSKRNPVTWTEYKDQAKNTEWPAGSPVLRGNGNGGVASVVADTSGAIGYVELSSARAAKKADGTVVALDWALVDGPDGSFRAPDLDGQARGANCEQAASTAVTPASTLSPGWHAVSITDSVAGYPICSFTYGLVFNNLDSAYAGTLTSPQAQTLVDYLGVAVDDLGQGRLAAQDFGRLPANIQQIAKAGLASINEG